MELLLCVILMLLIAVFLILLVVLERIKKLEFFFQSQMFRQAKPDSPPQQKTFSAQPGQEQNPPEPAIQEQTPQINPMPQPVKVLRPLPPQQLQTAKPVFTPPPQKPPSALDNFISWLWMGNNKGKEGVSKEYAVATTWLIRAGVLVLLCGIVFFLKYSIEKDLISPAVRICLTFLTGLAMFTGGLLMVNKRFHILATGILSAGIITLYMGSFAGYKLYHILPGEVSFGFMILTTIAAMLVSMKLNLLPVALTGCTGAYLTPVLLSDGSGNLPFFLGYTAFISLGLLIVSRERRWRSLEAVSFGFSFLLMSYGTMELSEKINWLCPGFLFLNHLVFSLIPLVRKKEFPVGKLEWLLPILSTVFAMGLGIFMLDELMSENQNIAFAAYALLLSGISLGEGLWLNKRNESGTAGLPAFLCASIFSLALAIPLAFDNQYAVITGWSVLGFVLTLEAERYKNRTLLILSLIVFVLSFVGILVSTSGFSEKTVMDRFFLGGMFTICLLGSGFVLRKNTAGKNAPEEQLFSEVMRSDFFAGGIAFLCYTSNEVYLNLKNCDALYNFRHGGLSVWWGILVVGLILFGIRKNFKALRICGLILFLLCLVKIYCVDISGLDTLGKVIAFLLLGILFLVAATAYILFRKRFTNEEEK